MRLCLLLAVLILPWLIGTAEAGAWPRAKGRTFLATTGQIDASDETGLRRQSFTLYAEYGATERLTLGLDLGGDALRMTKTIAFARWPIGRPAQQVKIAVELGLGQVSEVNALRPGLSLGRGLTLWRRQGWAVFDGRVIVFGGRAYTRFAPSYVHAIRPGAHLEVGLILPLSGGGERGVKLGLWRSF